MDIMNIKKITAAAALLAASFCPGPFCHAAGDEGNAGELIVVAHRGGARLGPENSLGCIELGMEAGADWIEIDVHLSADREIVVCHDPTVDRTTDGKGEISAMKYSELRKLRLLDRDGKPTDEHLPTLEEVLRLIDGRASLLLEIKYSESSLPGIEQACIDCIRRLGAEDRVIIQSFDDEVVIRTHELAPDIRVEKLLSSAKDFDFGKYSFAASFNINYKAATREFVDMVHSLGKEVKVWTLNEYDAELVKMVDGVITDDPGIFL